MNEKRSWTRCAICEFDVDLLTLQAPLTTQNHATQAMLTASIESSVTKKIKTSPDAAVQLLLRQGSND